MQCEFYQLDRDDSVVEEAEEAKGGAGANWEEEKVSEVKDTADWFEEEVEEEHTAVSILDAAKAMQQSSFYGATNCNAKTAAAKEEEDLVSRRPGGHLGIALAAAASVRAAQASWGGTEPPPPDERPREALKATAALDACRLYSLAEEEERESIGPVETSPRDAVEEVACLSIVPQLEAQSLASGCTYYGDWARQSMAVVSHWRHAGRLGGAGQRTQINRETLEFLSTPGHAIAMEQGSPRSEQGSPRSEQENDWWGSSSAVAADLRPAPRVVRLKQQPHALQQPLQGSMSLPPPPPPPRQGQGAVHEQQEFLRGSPRRALAAVPSPPATARHQQQGSFYGGGNHRREQARR